MFGILNYRIRFLFSDFIRRFFKFVSVNYRLVKPVICSENISEIGDRKAQIYSNLSE